MGYDSRLSNRPYNLGWFTARMEVIVLAHMSPMVYSGGIITWSSPENQVAKITETADYE